MRQGTAAADPLKKSALKQSITNYSPHAQPNYLIKNLKKNKINKDELQHRLFPEVYGDARRPSYFEKKPLSQMATAQNSQKVTLTTAPQTQQLLQHSAEQSQRLQT